MINDPLVNELNLQLQRIFCLPITRSTFHELQNLFLALSKGDQKLAGDYFELLLSGQIKPGMVADAAQEKLRTIIERFTVPARVAKEVYERGEFVSVMSSDTITQGKDGENPFFMTLVRRVDGQELRFINNPQGALYSINHFLQRLEKLTEMDKGLEALRPFLEQFKDLKKRLGHLESKVGAKEPQVK